jgi:predicted phosphoadenosine phosphosulfate sulfurtransferase
MKSKIENYIKTWEKRGYSKGIPDEIPTRLSQLNLAPSYKDICIAILKNDIALKSLGLQPKKSKYYHILKKIELEHKSPVQLDFFHLLTFKQKKYDKL